MSAPGRAIARCPWAKGELYCRYHDEEWGVPVHDDSRLFEMLILEGAQAGLTEIAVVAGEVSPFAHACFR